MGASRVVAGSFGSGALDGGGDMHLVARRDLLRALVVALMLGAVLLVFVLVSRPAQAAFPGDNWEVYVANADGSGIPTNVSENGAIDEDPELSPDGTKVVFSSLRSGND